MHHGKLFYRKSFFILIGTFIVASIGITQSIPLAFLSIITVFVLLQLFNEDLYLRSIERIIGPGIAVLLTSLILLPMQYYPVISIVMAFILIFIFMYYYANMRHHYAMVLGGITIAFMTFIGWQENTIKAIKIGIFWEMNIIIGALVVFLLGAFFYGDHRTILTTFKRLSFTFKPLINHLSDITVWSYSAFLASTRIVFTLTCIFIINWYCNWQHITLQALIAGGVVAAQFTQQLTHHRALMRILGVCSGSLIAILLAWLFHLNSNWWLIAMIIAIVLWGISELIEIFPYYDYALLQAGVMVPLIMLTSGHHEINFDLAYQRGLGAIEGGLLGLLIFHLFTFFSKPISLKICNKAKSG